MIPCPNRDELLLLLDGEVTENRAAELRAHLASCPSCAAEWRAQEALAARLAAPVPGAPAPGAVQAVLRRIAERRTLGEPRRLFRIAFPAAALALAAAATVIAAVLVRPQPPPDGFLPRGGGEAAWEQHVGVELWAVERPPRKLTEGATVSGETAYVADYRNLTGAAAYLLVFAVDAAGEVHWLYPSYPDARTDPVSPALPPSHATSTLPDSVVLEGVPPGPLWFLTVTSPRPLHVSQVERLRPAEFDAAELRRRFPGSRVEALQVRLAAPARVP